MCHYFFWFESAFIRMRGLNQKEYTQLCKISKGILTILVIYYIFCFQFSKLLQKRELNINSPKQSDFFFFNNCFLFFQPYSTATWACLFMGLIDSCVSHSCLYMLHSWYCKIWICGVRLLIWNSCSIKLSYSINKSVH